MSRSMMSQLLCGAAVSVCALSSVAAVAADNGSGGHWTGGVSQDPMTDAETAVIRSRVAVEGSTYELRLKCERPDIRAVQLAVFDAQGKPLAHAGTLQRLEYRIDKAAPQSLVPAATDYPNVYDLRSGGLDVAHLLAARRLVLRGYRGDETPVFTFHWDREPALGFTRVCAGLKARPPVEQSVAPAAVPARRAASEPPTVVESSEPSKAQQAAASRWRDAMVAHIASAWSRPPNVSATIKTSIAVVLKPTADGAEVVSATLARSSGNGVYDQSVRRAILKASPLPMPADPSVFEDHVTFRLMLPDLQFPD